MSWTFALSKNGVTGTRFVLLPETTQIRKVIPERWEANKVSRLSQLTAVREFIGLGTERKNLGRLLQIPWVEKIMVRIWRNEGSKSLKKRKTERRNPAKGLLWVFSRALVSTCMWGNYLKLEKELTTQTKEKES